MCERTSCAVAVQTEKDVVGIQCDVDIGNRTSGFSEVSITAAADDDEMVSNYSSVVFRSDRQQFHIRFTS